MANTLFEQYWVLKNNGNDPYEGDYVFRNLGKALEYQKKNYKVVGELIPVTGDKLEDYRIEWVK